MPHLTGFERLGGGRPGYAGRVDSPGPASARAVPGIDDLTEIGRGASSIVYRGRQTDLARDVAVKVVWSWGTPEADLARWRREVTAMARLANHPNIVEIYDGGTTTDGQPYLVMPYVAGGTLGDRLRATGALPPGEVVAIGVKLASALASAHANGVLHRDVKPDNVLLSPYGEPQLTDFGIARLVDATATATGGVHATVAYAAPEVLLGEPASEASDVYGLGATLHACLTGAPPYPPRDGEALMALATRVVQEPAPDLRDAGVPDALAAVVGQALAKARADRIPTAEELGRRLAEVAAAPAPAPAPAPVTARPARLRRGSLGAVAVLALLALLGALLATALTGDDDPAAPTTDVATTAAPPATVGDATLAYFAAIDAGDLEGAYAMTSPGFQAVQPFGPFQEFWGAFEDVSVDGAPTVDEGALTGRVRLMLDGAPEDYTLSFVRADDGTLLVDGPRPR